MTVEYTQVVKRIRVIDLENVPKIYQVNKSKCRIDGVYRTCLVAVMSDSLRPHGLQPARFLCQWDSPGKNTGVGCHFLLQGIFPTQGSNLGLLCLLNWQAGSKPLESPGKHPVTNILNRKCTPVLFCHHSKTTKIWSEEKNTLQAESLLLEPPGKPIYIECFNLHTHTQTKGKYIFK